MDKRNDDRIRLLQALAVTAELTGTEFSKAAAGAMADDMAAYPVEQVLGALVRCRRELRGRLTIAAIIERLEDGRPGPNEAWAMIPQDEHGSVVWTTEMAEAYGVACPLIRANQIIAARSAFVETYAALVSEARGRQLPPQWMPSLGFNVEHRQTVVDEAVRKGRLTNEHARLLLPPPAVAGVPLLENKTATPMPEHVREQLHSFLRLKVVNGGKR